MRPLDGIYARGRATVRSVIRGETPLDKRASDHRMLVAEIEL